MNWLKEYGLIANYRDYLDLPLSVLEDARLVMHVDVQHREQQRNGGGASQPTQDLLAPYREA
jgi:hypothetical protein